MMDKKPKKLFKVASEFNIATQSIVDSLGEHNFDVENRPNTKITPDMYEVLTSIYGDDKAKQQEYTKAREVYENRRNQMMSNRNESDTLDSFLEDMDDPVSGEKVLSPNSDGVPSSLGSKMSDVDLLGRQNLVDSLADMIASPKQDTPFTIGLLGDWGSGKSNVMHLLRKALDDRDEKESFYFADFNAWQYEHTDNMAAGVAQEVLKGLLGELSFWQKFKIKWAFGKEENGLLLPIILSLVFLSAIFSFIMIFFGDSTGWIAVFGVSAAIIGGFIKQIFTILEHPLTAKVNSYLKLPSYAVHLGTIPMLKRHLQTLCDLIIPHDEKNPNRLIVFVDDLDRCEPQAISKTLDAIRLVMDIENVVVIIGIDPRIAFRAVEKQYMELADDKRTSADIARDYLGKIIQLPVILNQPGENELEKFISDSLFKGVDDSPEKVKQEELIERGEEMNTDNEANKNAETKEKTTVSHGQSATKVDEDGPEKLQVGISKQGKDSNNIVETVSKQEDLSEDMAETVAERKYFTDLCKLFGLHNPRKLIRLRNCYRLLKRIYRPDGNEWILQMTMLFWLEFLYGQKKEDRILIEACILDKDTDSLEGCLKIVDVKSEEIALRLKDQFNLKNGDFEFYANFEKQVKRVVLPHSESAKRAKDEEQIDRGDTDINDAKESADERNMPKNDVD